MSSSTGPLGIPIGSQTYPHRQRIMDGHFAGLCQDMAALGVASLELCSPGRPGFAPLSDARETRRILDDHGLKCPSAHVELAELQARHQEIIDWALEIGMTQIGCPSLGPSVGPGEEGAVPLVTMDAVRRAADEYNRLAGISARAGLQQFLHSEIFELSPVGGRLTYQVLFDLLDPALVKMQFHMQMMRIVGDPVTYFHRYPGRFLSLHLQGVDLNAPAPPLPPPGTPLEAVMRQWRATPQLPLGRDSVDWPALFAAAKTGGVKNYFVEQSWDLTVQSVAYLKTLKV